jgi:acyl-coenzyme A thioesterase PaaI-like protein
VGRARVTPIDVFARIYDLPPFVRDNALSFGIPRVLPITKGLGIRVVSLDEDHVETTMPLSRRAVNHIGTMYIGALLIHAEVTMATLVVGLCRPPSFRVLVKKSEAEYFAKAKGRVRAVCRPTEEERAALARCRALAAGEKSEAWIAVDTTSMDSTVLSTTRFLLSVSRRRER